MGLLLGIAIGLVLGAGAAYLLLYSKISQQQQVLKQAHHVLEEREKLYESRLEITVKSLQAHFKTQLNAQLDELRQQYEAKQPALEATDEPPTVIPANESVTVLQSLPDAPDDQNDEKEPEAPLNATEYEPMSAPVAAFAEPVAVVEPPVTTESGSSKPSPAPIAVTEPPAAIEPVAFADAPAGIEPAPIPELLTSEPVSSEPVTVAEPVAEEPSIAESTSSEAVAIATPPATTEPVVESTPQPANHSLLLATRYTPPAHEVGKTILSWGNSGSTQYVPLLIDYAHHTDSHLRGLAASTLGQIAASQRGRADTQRAIPVLEKLSRDPDSSVRRAAVEALGKFSSERVISPLKLALRDVDPDVVKSASEAIANFKDYRGNRLKNVKSPKPKSVNRK